VDLVSPCLRGGTHAILALGTTVAFRKLLPEKTLTASPLGILQYSTWLVVLFSKAVGLFKVCERGHRRHCGGFAGIARATQPRTPTDTLQHFGSIKLAANQTVSVKAMLKDDKAPEIRTATLLMHVSVHQSHALCSLCVSVSVVALPSRGTCAFPTDT
jgi:hypothetical protein